MPVAAPAGRSDRGAERGRRRGGVGHRARFPHRTPGARGIKPLGAPFRR